MRVDPHCPTVFILGAGASFGARSGLPQFENPPPLGNKIARYLLDWLDANHPNCSDPRTWHRRRSMSSEYCDVDTQRIVGDDWSQLEKWLRNTAADQTFDAHIPHAFERHTTELDRQGDRDTLEALNRLIGIAMISGHLCNFAYGEDRFDTLLKHFPNIVAVITLNYDVLLEEALDRADRAFEYPFSEGHALGNQHPHSAESWLPVYKLHGSINWAPCGVASSATWEFAQQNARNNPTSVSRNLSGTLSYDKKRIAVYLDAKGPSMRSNLVGDYQRGVCGSPQDPILATYAKQKPAITNRRTLGDVQKKVIIKLSALKPDTQIIALGVRAPLDHDDDPSWNKVCEVIAQSPAQNRFYIGPESSDRKAMQGYGFEPLCKTFEDFISQLQSNLRPSALNKPSSAIAAFPVSDNTPVIPGLRAYDLLDEEEI